MQNETKNCQNCKNDFVIESEDFSFYEKIKVPPPTFCSQCRMQRRMMFRNERNFYRAKCNLCKKNIISIFDPEIVPRILCSQCWWGDEWDGTEQGVDYDPNRNFFDQFRELQLKTPFMHLVVGYSTLVNSEYVNHAGACKNCYLLFNADYCENVYYSSTMTHIKDTSDCIMMNKTELSYGSIAGDGSRVMFSENCPESVNVWYSKDCMGCTDCFGCVNLHQKSYHIFNEPYSREDYYHKIKEMRLDLHSTHKSIREGIYDFWNKFPRKYMYGRMNHNSTGVYVYGSKNAKDCFQVAGVEDSRYCQLVTAPPFANNYDVTEWGMGVESCIDSITVGAGANDIKYCSGVWDNVRNVEYSRYIVSSNNCFGCVNLRKKEYCILNKQYSKEEYEKFKAQIIEDMKKNPYVDSHGRVWSYGDFFPYDLALYPYNASFADQYFELPKEKIIESGWGYKDTKKPEHSPTVRTEDIPDSIFDIRDDFVNEILSCESCSKPYRIAKGELELLKRFEIPVPRSCPDCRHMARVRRMNPPKLWSRACMCGSTGSPQATGNHGHEGKCEVEFETSYAPERPEIVYCEKCYQQEVY